MISVHSLHEASIKKRLLLKKKGSFATRSRLNESHHRLANRLRLHEGQELTSYIDILNTAGQFLSEKKNNASSLPADSPERLMVEAVDGLLHKYSLSKEENPPNEDIRRKISSLVTALDEHLEAQSGGELVEYLKKLKSGLLDLHNSIDPAGEGMGAEIPEGGGTEDAPKDPGQTQEEEPQPPEDEVTTLSRELGI